METLNYLREYASGFRMPDLSKIWYGQDIGDEVDSGNNESLLIQVKFRIFKKLRLIQYHKAENTSAFTHFTF